MKSIKTSLYFAYLYGWKFLTRNPITLFALLLEPLIIPYLFYIVNRGVTDVTIVGAIIGSVFTVGLAVAGDVTYLDYVCKYRDMVMASPMSLQTYLLGISLSEIFFSLPVLVVLIALLTVSMGLGAIILILILSPLIMLLFITAVSFGLIISVTLQWAYRAREVFTLVAVVLTVFPAVYYPYSIIPPPYRVLSFLTPTGAIAAIAQDMLAGSQPMLWLVFVSLVYALLTISLILAKGWALLRK